MNESVTVLKLILEGRLHILEEFSKAIEGEETLCMGFGAVPKAFFHC